MNVIRKLGVSSLILGSSLFGVSLVSYVVYPGEHAIIFDVVKGQISDTPSPPGLNFRIPGMQQIIRYETRIMPFDYTASSGTKDLQRVDVKIKIFYRPDPKYLKTIHLDLNRNYATKVLPSIGNEVLKAVIAQYDADELLKQRVKVSSEIKEALIDRANEYNIILEDVSIYELGFRKEFMDSIERKQVAQQEAEAYKYSVLLREEEMKVQVIEAEGQSEAARMVSDAVSKYGTGLITLRKIQASKEIVENLSKSRNVGFVPSGGNMLYSLNV